MSELPHRELQSRPLDDRVADVCPTCGQHMIKSEADRLKWLNDGGEASCENCGTKKTRTTT